MRTPTPSLRASALTTSDRTSATVGDSGETNPGNNTDAAVATVVTQAAFSLTKTAQGPFRAGGF